jgi:hypothetical protein
MDRVEPVKVAVRGYRYGFPGWHGVLEICFPARTRYGRITFVSIRAAC